MHVGVDTAVSNKLSAIASLMQEMFNTEKVSAIVYAEDAAIPYRTPGKAAKVEVRSVFAAMGDSDEMRHPPAVLMNAFAQAMSLCDGADDMQELLAAIATFIINKETAPTTFNA